MKEKVIVTEEEFPTSIYSTKEWADTVEIKNWEHDFEKKIYVIMYVKK